MVSNTFGIFESLFSLFWTLGIIVGTVVLALMVFLVIKYRARRPDEPDPADTPQLGQSPPERGHRRTVLISLALSSIILAFLIFGTFSAVQQIETIPTEPTLRIKVTAFQWGWKFQYPNGNVSTGELRVPVGGVVVLNVTSEDVFHNLGLYQFKIKIDAIPGRHNVIWFKADKPGTYTIQCYELCGIGHAYMKAKLTVMPPEEFGSWYSTLGA